MHIPRAFIALLSFGMACSGCGPFIAYDGQGPGSGATLAPLDDFPEVTALNHLGLAAIVAEFTTISPDEMSVALDYTRLSQDEEALFILDQYLASMAAVDPSALEGVDERRAYWINAYNAGVIRGVIDGFGGDLSWSVLDEPGFFTQPRFIFGGVSFSLDQVEHAVLRVGVDDDRVRAALELAPEVDREKMRRWGAEAFPDGDFDARIHAAINCGAISCPNLWGTSPYTLRGDVLDEQLDVAVQMWLADPDKGAGPDGISRLFDWFGVDFVAEAGSIDAWIEEHRVGGLEGVDTDTFFTYDWALNATPAAP
ncbi:MAG: DUF547 domain-containing protein [Myxococcota bacterium]